MDHIILKMTLLSMCPLTPHLFQGTKVCAHNHCVVYVMNTFSLLQPLPQPLMLGSRKTSRITWVKEELTSSKSFVFFTTCICMHYAILSCTSYMCMCMYVCMFAKRSTNVAIPLLVLCMFFVGSSLQSMVNEILLSSYQKVCKFIVFLNK